MVVGAGLLVVYALVRFRSVLHTVAYRPWRRHTAVTTKRHQIGRCVSSYTEPELFWIHGHAGACVNVVA